MDSYLETRSVQRVQKDNLRFPSLIQTSHPHTLIVRLMTVS